MRTTIKTATITTRPDLLTIKVEYATGRIVTIRRTPEFISRLMHEISTNTHPAIITAEVDTR